MLESTVGNLHLFKIKQMSVKSKTTSSGQSNLLEFISWNLKIKEASANPNQTQSYSSTGAS